MDSNRSDFPSNKVLEAYGVLSPYQAEPLSSPWNPNRVYLVSGKDRESFVLKSWIGADGLGRVFQETEFLTLLKKTDFSEFAQLIRTVDGQCYFIESDSRAWSAYELV